MMALDMEPIAARSQTSHADPVLDDDGGVLFVASFDRFVYALDVAARRSKSVHGS